MILLESKVKFHLAFCLLDLFKLKLKLAILVHKVLNKSSSMVNTIKNSSASYYRAITLYYNYLIIGFPHIKIKKG